MKIYYLNFILRLIDNEQPSTRASGLEWTSYHPLEAIYEWLDEQLLAYPNILTGYEVGQSYENRTIRAVRLSHKEVFNILSLNYITHIVLIWFCRETQLSSSNLISTLESGSPLPLPPGGLTNYLPQPIRKFRILLKTSIGSSFRCLMWTDLCIHILQ